MSDNVPAIDFTDSSQVLGFVFGVLIEATSKDYDFVCSLVDALPPAHREAIKTSALVLVEVAGR